MFGVSACMYPCLALFPFQIDVACHAFHQHDELCEAVGDYFGREDQANPKDVGHNIYILAHQV